MSEYKNRKSRFSLSMFKEIPHLMIRGHLSIAMSILILSTCASAVQAKPNFTGDWTLNIEQSNFGMTPAPDSLILKIEHNEPTITSVMKQTGGSGDTSIETNCTIGGGPCTFETQAADIKATSKWDGDTLVTNATVEINGMEVMKTLERMSISEDGKTLTLDVTYMTAMGDTTIVAVLNKQ